MSVASSGLPQFFLFLAVTAFSPPMTHPCDPEIRRSLSDHLSWLRKVCGSETTCGQLSAWATRHWGQLLAQARSNPLE